MRETTEEDTSSASEGARGLRGTGWDLRGWRRRSPGVGGSDSEAAGTGIGESTKGNRDSGARRKPREARKNAAYTSVGGGGGRRHEVQWDCTITEDIMQGPARGHSG